MRSSDCDRSFTLSTTTSETAARCLLEGLEIKLKACGVKEETCGASRIVLAEAINNIVEHAYGPGGIGPVTLRVRVSPTQLAFDLTDSGTPLPGLKLPVGALPDNNGPLETLPEGGFGWFLIKSLTSELTYARINGENRLFFKIPTNSTAS